MSVELTTTYTITGPSGVDGFGEVAVLNDKTSGNFVGYLEDLSFAREIRESADPVVEGDGGAHGSFYSGRLPFTMDIRIERAATYALSNARADKLFAALNAMRSDGKITWTESGRSVPTELLFRQQESPRGPNSEGHVLFGGVSASALLLSTETAGVAPGSGLTNSGKAATFPRITFTAGASGTVVLSRTSPSPTQTLTLNIGAGGLTASSATEVNFATRTVTQGSASKYGAVVVPATWWAMAPGANTISVSGASSITVYWRHAWLP